MHGSSILTGPVAAATVPRSTSTMNIQRYLDALTAIYRANEADSPHQLRLPRPAAKRLMTKAEKATGASLDADLRHLWELFDGSNGAPFLRDGKYLFSYALLSVEESLDHRSAFEDRAPHYSGRSERTGPRDARVGNGWFSPGWLPFAAEDDHAVLLVDHQPLGSGTPGQVIRYIHDPDRIEYVCDSISELLQTSINAIQADPLEFLQIY